MQFKKPGPIEGTYDDQGEYYDMKENHHMTAEELEQYYTQKMAAQVQHLAPLDITTLFEREKKLQRKLYGASWPWDLDRFIMDYAMHAHMEADEMLREVNYKLQTKKRKEIDMRALKMEVVDLFLFGLAAATAVFQDDEEFLETVLEKIQYNETRSDWDANK